MITYFRDIQTKKVRKATENYLDNRYFVFKLMKTKYLITTRHRAWIILSEKDYKLLLNHEVHQNPKLFKILFALNVIYIKDNTSDAIQQYKNKYSYLKQPPTLNAIVPTLRCNLKCDYCRSRSGPNIEKKDMSKSLAKKTVDFIFSIPHPSRKVHIEFQGGEPLLRWDIIKYIIEYTRKKSKKRDFLLPSFSITTNLLLMNEEIAKDIIDYRKNKISFNITTSLDGPKEIHDSRRKYPDNKGSYDNVVHWIDILQKKYKIPLSVISVITQNSLGHEKEIIDELIKHNLINFKFLHVDLIGRLFDNYQKKKDNLSVSPQEFFNFWKNSLEYILQLNKRGIKVKEKTIIFLLSNLLSLKSTYMCIRKPCGAGISQLEFGCDGTIHACDGGKSVKRLELGNIKTHAYQDIAMSKTVFRLRSIRSENLPICSTCPWGPYCGYCVARGINQHGQFIPKIPEDYDCQLYSQIIPYLFKQFLNKEKAKLFSKWVSNLFGDS